MSESNGLSLDEPLPEANQQAANERAEADLRAQSIPEPQGCFPVAQPPRPSDEIEPSRRAEVALPESRGPGFDEPRPKVSEPIDPNGGEQTVAESQGANPDGAGPQPSERADGSGRKESVTQPGSPSAEQARPEPSAEAGPSGSAQPTPEDAELWPHERLLAASDNAAGAVRSLWSEGRVALAFQVMAADLSRLAPLVDAADPLEPLTKEVRALEERLGRLTLPWVDREFSKAHARFLMDAAELRARWVKAQRRKLEPDPLRRRRRVRYLAAGLAILAVLVIWRVWPKPYQVIASGVFSPEYVPAMGADGIAATEWLGADGQPGWIELRFRKPRAITHVRLKNGRGNFALDRAIREYEIQIYNGPMLVAKVRGEFKELDREPPWREISLQPSRGDRVRLEALSYHAKGPALAEIEVP